MNEKIQEFYRKKIRCQNCNSEKEWEIPKGVDIVEFKVNTRCPNCGCYILK